MVLGLRQGGSRVRFIVTGPLYYNYSSSTVQALEELGHEVLFFPMKEFYKYCSYFQRKLYKLGNRSLRDKWELKWENQFLEFCERNYATDSQILVLTGGMVSTRLLEKMDAYNKILLMWDSVKRSNDDLLNTLKFYDARFVFEHRDVEYVQGKCGVSSIYLPLGFDADIYYPRENLKDIDISFIGTLNADRLAFINRVAVFAQQNGLKLYVAGKWYEDKYFWKERKFKRDYPELYRCIDNRWLLPKEVAEVYCKSKICLNINQAMHKSVSPRTFEIAATKSFQVINRGQEYLGMLAPGCDFIEYEDVDDLLDIMQYYLNNDQRREAIAESGYKQVEKQWSITAITKKMLQYSSI